MNRPSRGPWGCSDQQEDSRRFGHGVAQLWYDAAALRPSHNDLARAAGAGRGRGQPDAVRAGRAVCDQAVTARCPTEPDAPQLGVARAGARCAQPPAAHPAALDPRPAGRHPRAGGGLPLDAGHAGLPGARGRGARKTVRQAPPLGRLHLLLRFQAQSVWLPHRTAVVHPRPDRALAHPRRLSALAAQADVRAGALS
jgi:hypothetical protein